MSTLLKYLRKNEWNSFVSKIKPNDPKIFKVNKRLIKHKKPNHPICGELGLVYDPQEKAELFADILAPQVTWPQGRPSTEEQVNTVLENLSQQDEDHLYPISPGEIENIIKPIPQNKAPGPDGITNAALNHYPTECYHISAKFFNTCLHLKYFVTKWKNAIIITIPKHRKDLNIP